MPAPNEISISQLNRLFGTPDSPVIVDISIEPDFEKDPFLIPGSIRHPHTDIPGLVARLAGRRAIIACQKGIKLSQDLAAWQRSDGIVAEYLEGGMSGWRDHPETTRIPAAAIPYPVGGATLWVTRHRPKIDRITCPWLIRRSVDPEARLLFVSPSEVDGGAARYGATPFDVEDALFTHRCNRCTFDTMLDVFDLHSDPLDRLATVFRGADINQHDIAPEASGLMAISVGLSHQFKEDNRQLGAGLMLYDALYRWARDGFEEGHDWPAIRP